MIAKLKGAQKLPPHPYTSQGVYTVQMEFTGYRVRITGAGGYSHWLFLAVALKELT